MAVEREFARRAINGTATHNILAIHASICLALVQIASQSTSTPQPSTLRQGVMFVPQLLTYRAGSGVEGVHQELPPPLPGDRKHYRPRGPSVHYGFFDVQRRAAASECGAWVGTFDTNYFLCDDKNCVDH